MDQVFCSKCGANSNKMAKYCSHCGFELPVATSEKEKESMPMEVNSSSEKKKKIIFAVTFVIMFGLSFFAVQYFFFDNPSFDEKMMEVASEINKSCPIMVDTDTRLDNTLAMPDNVFMYNYTLVHMEKADINVEDLRAYLKPRLVNTVKSNPDMKIYRDNGITMAYNYNDKNGVFLVRIDVTPALYN